MDIVMRKTWGAEDEGRKPPRLSNPVSFVFMAFIKKDYSSRRGRVSPGPRPDTKVCAEEVRYIQRGDMLVYNFDIRYNFVVCPDGLAYEGRGWGRMPFLPTKYKSMMDRSLYIGYLGDFKDEEPPNVIYQVRDNLFRMGVENYYINKKFLHFELANPWKKAGHLKQPENYMSSIYM